MPISRALKDAVRGAGMAAPAGRIAPPPVSPAAGLTPKGGTLAGRVMRPAPQVGKTPLSAPVASGLGQVKSPYSRPLGGVRRTVKPMGGY
jgi:hypothetical protein